MKEYQSEALMVIHQDAKGLHRLGLITDAEMREYDRDCLVQTSKTGRKAEQSPARGKTNPVTV